MERERRRIRAPLSVRWLGEVARHDREVEDLLTEAIAGGEGLVERAANALGLTRGALRRLLERYPKAAELVGELRSRNGYRTGRLAGRKVREEKAAMAAGAAAPDDEAPPRF